MCKNSTCSRRLRGCAATAIPPSSSGPFAGCGSASSASSPRPLRSHRLQESHLVSRNSTFFPPFSLLLHAQRRILAPARTEPGRVGTEPAEAALIECSSAPLCCSAQRAACHLSCFASRMKSATSSAVRTARTMRRSAAPSLVARSAGRRGARRVERDGCARRARRPRRGDEVDGRGDGDDVAVRRRVRRARRDRALRRRRDEVLASMLARLGATPTRSAPDARAISRTISDAAEHGTPARSARRERAESARAHGLRPADLRARPPVLVIFGERSYSATRARDGRNARARRLGVPGVA